MKRVWLPLVAGVSVSFVALNILMAQTSPVGGDNPAMESKTTMTAQKDAPPRKIVVGSLMYAMWGEYPGLQKRLDTLAGFIDQMSAQAAKKYPGAGLDIACLPEIAVNGGKNGSAAQVSEPLEGPVLDTMAAAAKRNKCYVVVPLYLAEKAGKGPYYNACVLLDRQGKVAGIYRKVYPVASPEESVLEGGCLPGKEFPVFQCDFGKLGIQICFDMSYDAGWETLARKGAELVIWSTQSPQILGAQARSHKHHYYLLSTTWRNNISLIDPTGAVIAQNTAERPGFLVEQIDLSYMLVDWQAKLGNGKAFTDKYGKAAGYRYSEAEDGGIFWSNDPKIPITRMVRELGLELPQTEIDRNRKLQDKLRGGLPSLD